MVAERDVEEFVRAKRLKGLSGRTIRDEVRYIRLALSELNWVLEPEGIREYIAGLAEEGEYNIARHVSVGLKSILKTVLKPRDPALFRLLYDSFTVYKHKATTHVKLPTLEQLRAIWHQLPSVEARFYFTLLAECGLRPSEPFLVSIDDLDLEHGMIRIGKVTETKRSFVAFLRPEVVDWVKVNYLPAREALIKAKLDIVKADYLGVNANAGHHPVSLGYLLNTTGVPGMRNLSNGISSTRQRYAVLEASPIASTSVSFNTLIAHGNSL
jgi:integrase